MNPSKATELAWRIAAVEAGAANAREIEPAHLLIGVTKLCDVDVHRHVDDARDREDITADVSQVAALFKQAAFDHTRFRRRLRSAVARDALPVPRSQTKISRSAESKLVFTRAASLAMEERQGAQTFLLRHLLQALIESKAPAWESILAEMGKADLSTQLFSPGRRRPTPTLDRFGRDLTDLARQGKLNQVIGRDREIRELERALIRTHGRSAALVGEAGVGKTSIVEGLAQHISSKQSPMLDGNRVIELSLNLLASGTIYRGMFEERLAAVIEEAAGDNIILFLDEIHTLLGAGGHEGSATDAAQILKPALANGKVSCIGSTTITEYRASIETDAALARRFRVIHVEEPDRDATLAILKELRQEFDSYYHVTITDEALVAAIDLSRRYIPDQRLPHKAITLIEDACTRVVVPTMGPEQGRPTASTIGPEQGCPTASTIGRANIATVVAKQCRIPIEQLTDDETQRLVAMEDTLRRRLIGQDEAVATVAEVVRTARAGLGDPRRPSGVFLFAGPTGTGKTELAKALAEFLFYGDIEGKHLIRLDMSEYQEPHTVARLIGSPPGYRDHEKGGQLTEPVRTYPYSVVLFDEIEKAHPDVLNILLQVLDEGHIADSHGRHISFKDTVVILTSNLGAHGYDERQHGDIGFALDAAGGAAAKADAFRARIMATLREKVRPELLNRIGHQIVFQPLEKSAARGILDKILRNVQAREALRGPDIGLALDDEAYALLLEKGFDVQTGAREMERTVEHLLVAPLAATLLGGRVAAGTTVRVGARDGQLHFLTQDSSVNPMNGLAWAP